MKSPEHKSVMIADAVQQESQVPVHESDVGVGGSQDVSSLKHQIVDDRHNEQCFPGPGCRLQDEHKHIDHLHLEITWQSSARVHSFQ